MSLSWRSALLGVLMLFWQLTAWADGTITHLSGVVSVLKADGQKLTATQGLKVFTGDTLLTGDKGYVRVELSDGGEMVLRPDTQLIVKSYHFVKERPTEDSLVFGVLKGGLRKITGAIGKRGNPDAYQINTTTATIGIRGTQFDIRICHGNCGSLPDGTYLSVRYGILEVFNAQGSLTITAGQYAFIPLDAPPTLLPRDPGIGFTPPATIPKLDEGRRNRGLESSGFTPASPERVTPEVLEGTNAPSTVRVVSEEEGVLQCSVE